MIAKLDLSLISPQLPGLRSSEKPLMLRLCAALVFLTILTAIVGLLESALGSIATLLVWFAAGGQHSDPPPFQVIEQFQFLKIWFWIAVAGVSVAILFRLLFAGKYRSLQERKLAGLLSKLTLEQLDEVLSRSDLSLLVETAAHKEMISRLSDLSANVLVLSPQSLPIGGFSRLPSFHELPHAQLTPFQLAFRNMENRVDRALPLFMGVVLLVLLSQLAGPAGLWSGHLNIAAIKDFEPSWWWDMLMGSVMLVIVVSLFTRLSMSYSIFCERSRNYTAMLAPLNEGQLLFLSENPRLTSEARRLARAELIYRLRHRLA